MFIILSYDINIKRVSKVMKICRKYLKPVQRSVYEGDLTNAQLNRLKGELGSCINTDEDAIIIFRLDSVKYARKEQIGQIVQFRNII